MGTSHDSEMSLENCIWNWQEQRFVDTVLRREELEAEGIIASTQPPWSRRYWTRQVCVNAIRHTEVERLATEVIEKVSKLHLRRNEVKICRLVGTHPEARSSRWNHED